VQQLIWEFFARLELGHGGGSREEGRKPFDGSLHDDGLSAREKKIECKHISTNAPIRKKLIQCVNQTVKKKIVFKKKSVNTKKAS
jgi:hypothetical protein